MRRGRFTDEELIKEHFKDHKATKLEVPVGGNINIELLYWQKPGTWINFIGYQVLGNILFVWGDLGEATYVWSDKISLKWLSGLNLHYFHGKCQASEGGRSIYWYDWDADEARSRVKEDLETYEGDKRKTYKEFIDSYGNSAIENKDEWVDWLKDNGDDFFGDDHWEWSYGAGQVIPIRCQLHLLGIRCAMRELEKEKEKEKDKS